MTEEYVPLFLHKNVEAFASYLVETHVRLDLSLINIPLMTFRVIQHLLLLEDVKYEPSYDIEKSVMESFQNEGHMMENMSSSSSEEEMTLEERIEDEMREQRIADFEDVMGSLEPIEEIPYILLGLRPRGISYDWDRSRHIIGDVLTWMAARRGLNFYCGHHDIKKSRMDEEKRERELVKRRKVKAERRQKAEEERREKRARRKARRKALGIDDEGEESSEYESM